MLLHQHFLALLGLSGTSRDPVRALQLALPDLLNVHLRLDGLSESKFELHRIYIMYKPRLAPKETKVQASV